MDLSLLLDPSLISNFVGSAAGALAGAGAAFLLEAHLRRKENAETQRSKLLHAQFLLAEKINSIANLKNTLDKISKETSAAEVRKIIYITLDERLSARELEPMIDGQWADQAAEILRCDRTYSDAVKWLDEFNQEKNRIESDPHLRSG